MVGAVSYRSALLKAHRATTLDGEGQGEGTVTENHRARVREPACTEHGYRSLTAAGLLCGYPITEGMLFAGEFGLGTFVERRAFQGHVVE